MRENVRAFFPQGQGHRGGSRIFFRRGCTRLLLYFNTNDSFLFFFAEYQLYEKTAGHLRGGGVRTPCTLPLDPPLGTGTGTRGVRKEGFDCYMPLRYCHISMSHLHFLVSQQSIKTPFVEQDASERHKHINDTEQTRDLTSEL